MEEELEGFVVLTDQVMQRLITDEQCICRPNDIRWWPEEKHSNNCVWHNAWHRRGTCDCPRSTE